MNNPRFLFIFVGIYIFTASLAVPIEPMFPVQTLNCAKVSFIVENGGAEHSHQVRNDELPHYCVALPSDLPTVVHLNYSRSPENCNYQVVQFSQPGCNDDNEISRNLFNAQRPKTTLNERKSICSFKLERTPWNPVRRTWVTVIFSTFSENYVTYKLDKKGCQNICSGPSETYYPNEVGVYEDDTSEVVERNHIVLFSEAGCQDEIRDTDGHAIAVKRMINLTAAVTRKRSTEIAQSFKLISV